MLNQNEKVERFAEEINKTALNQCKKIEKQTAKFSKTELSKLEAESKSQLEAKLQYEEENLKTKLNREISAYAASGKSDVIKCRNEIMDEVFGKVKEKLVKFTFSDEYKVLLKRSINDLVNAIEGKVIIYVKENDFQISKQICENISDVCEVRISEKIMIGLAFASNESETVFANDTLEIRLENQKQQFMASSGLTIQ